MSDSLALVARGTGVARGAMQSGAALARLFNGGAGALLSGAASGPLTLGGFAFAEMELPEGLQCGGQQQVAVHQFPGGGRTVDAMGPSEAPIAWAGIFLGPEAAARSQQLSEMRRAGGVVPLAWGGTVVPVVVTEVLIDWRNPHHVPYRVTCTVLPPPPAGGADADDEDDDLGDMDDENPEGGVLGGLADAAGDVGGVLTDVANEAGRILGIAQGALSAANSVVGPVTAALGIQVPYLQTISGGLGAVSGLVSFVGGAGAGLSSFGSQYGAGANSAANAVGVSAASRFAEKALDDLGDFNAGGFATADGYTDAFDGAGLDAGATPGTLADTTNAARDTALGATSGAAINSAQVGLRAQSSTRSLDSIPASPVPPSGGATVPAASAGDPSLAVPQPASAPVPAPAAVPDVTPPPVAAPVPGNATAPPQPAPATPSESRDLVPALFDYQPVISTAPTPRFGSDAAIRGDQLNLNGTVVVQTYAEAQAAKTSQAARANYGAETQATARAAGMSDAKLQDALVGTYWDPAAVRERAAALAAAQGQASP